MQVRKDRAATGADKAQSRKQERRQRFLDIRQQLDAFWNIVTSLEEENDKKFKAKLLESAKLDQEVLELFDTKIASLKSQAPVPASLPGPGARGYLKVKSPHRKSRLPRPPRKPTTSRSSPP